MLELWIPITLAAAFSQNIRSAMQKHLQGRLSTTGATFVRFGYGFPFALIYLAVLYFAFDFALPRPGPIFASYAVLGGIAQILATACLLASFSYRNFAVGTAYSKTDTLQSALIGIVLLGDHLTPGAAAGIAISLVGVVGLSLARAQLGAGNLARILAGPAALLGLGSGALFGISAVSYRAASQSLAELGGGPGFAIQAAYTLAWATFLQTLVMLAYMRLREPGKIRDALAAWRPALWVGLSGSFGSLCWFTALTIQSAAYVKALGQVELIFTFLASIFIFRERSTAVEFGGVFIIALGILILLLTP